MTSKASLPFNLLSQDFTISNKIPIKAVGWFSNHRIDE